MTSRFLICSTLALGLLPAAPALAQAGAANTAELLVTGSRISAGLPDGHALNLRLTSQRGGDNVWRAELLQERRFGENGGVAGAGFTVGLAPDWFGGANLTLGNGGPNWARKRLDLQLSTRLGAARENIAQLSVYRALYDNQRSDTGYGLALVSYSFSPLVLQAGVVFNVSDPGSVHSTMTTLSGTWGREGEQYISLRVSSGGESYQALGAAAQLVDFNSHSAALQWRRWLGPRWGVTAQLEHYRNPSYERLSLGAGLFSQW